MDHYVGRPRSGNYSFSSTFYHFLLKCSTFSWTLSPDDDDEATADFPAPFPFSFLLYIFLSSSRNTFLELFASSLLLISCYLRMERCKFLGRFFSHFYAVSILVLHKSSMMQHHEWETFGKKRKRVERRKRKRRMPLIRLCLIHPHPSLWLGGKEEDDMRREREREMHLLVIHKVKAWIEWWNDHRSSLFSLRLLIFLFVSSLDAPRRHPPRVFWCHFSWCLSSHPSCDYNFRRNAFVPDVSTAKAGTVDQCPENSQH